MGATLTLKFLQFNFCLVKLLFCSFKLQLECMIGACLPSYLVVAPLNLVVRLDVALVEHAVRVAKLADLRVRQLLQDCRRFMAHHIFAPVVSSIRQESLIFCKLFSTAYMIVVGT